jgi:hypothetical protein
MRYAGLEIWEGVPRRASGAGVREGVGGGDEALWPRMRIGALSAQRRRLPSSPVVIHCRGVADSRRHWRCESRPQESRVRRTIPAPVSARNRHPTRSCLADTRGVNADQGTRRPARTTLFQKGTALLQGETQGHGGSSADAAPLATKIGNLQMAQVRCLENVPLQERLPDENWRDE